MILDELPYRSLPNDLLQLFINLETLEKEKEILFPSSLFFLRRCHKVMFFDEDFHNFFIANLAKQSIQSDYRIFLLSVFNLAQKVCPFIFLFHIPTYTQKLESRKGVNCKVAEGNSLL